MKVTLYNIQGHHKSTFTIHEGINVIVGATDSGKSSIVRALHWLAFNKPAAASIKRNKSSKMYVEVKLENGTRIRREVSKTRNVYVLNGKVLKSFGTGVPLEVQSALGISEHHFKSQHDGFFLLSSSGPERARTINKFLNMDIITRTGKNASAKVREARSEEQALKKIEKDLQDKIKTLLPNEELAKRIIFLSEKIEELDSIQKQSNKSISVWNELKALQRSYKELNLATGMLSDGLKACEQGLGQAKTLNDALDHLAGLSEMDKDIAELEDIYKNLQLQISKIKIPRCSKCGAILKEY